MIPKAPSSRESLDSNDAGDFNHACDPCEIIQETNIVNSQPKLRPLEAKLAFKEVAQKLPCNIRLIIHK